MAAEFRRSSIDTGFNEAATKPAACPSCNGTRIDTLAKVITVSTMWRCRECENTWTIASHAASAPRPPATRR